MFQFSKTTVTENLHCPAQTRLLQEEKEGYFKPPNIEVVCYTDRFLKQGPWNCYKITLELEPSKSFFNCKKASVYSWWSGFLTYILIVH